MSPVLSQRGRRCGGGGAADLGSSEVMVAGRGRLAGHEGSHPRCSHQGHHGQLQGHHLSYVSLCVMTVSQCLSWLGLSLALGLVRN